MANPSNPRAIHDAITSKFITEVAQLEGYDLQVEVEPIRTDDNNIHSKLWCKDEFIKVMNFEMNLNVYGDSSGVTDITHNIVAKGSTTHSTSTTTHVEFTESNSTWFINYVAKAMLSSLRIAIDTVAREEAELIGWMLEDEERIDPEVNHEPIDLNQEKL